jgi:hypothetical protein
MIHELFLKTMKKCKREGYWGIFILVMGVALTAYPSATPSQNATLAWNPSPSAGVAGYLLSYGSDSIHFPRLLNVGTNTSVTVSNLQPGTNYFVVQAYDAAFFDESPRSAPTNYAVPLSVIFGNPSVLIGDNQNTITNSISSATMPVVDNTTINFALLVSSTNGTPNGTLSPKRSVQSYEAGKTYTVTATANKGWLFATWASNGVQVSTVPKYTFTVANNLTLQADFIPNPIKATTYHGLFQVSTNVAQNSSGSFTATVSSTGAFSAKIRLEPQNYSYSGQFSVTNLLAPSKTIKILGGKDSITVQLVLDLTSNIPIYGTISNENWIAQLEADPVTYSTTNHAPQAGKYTLLIPGGTTNSSTQPGGNGFASVTVSDLGSISLSGILGDGTTFTSTSIVSTNVSASQAECPFYVSLYNGKGSIFGWFIFTNNGITNGLIPTSWFKLAQSTSKLYPNGFTNDAIVTGSLYTNNLSNLGFTSSQLSLTLANGNLPQSLSDQLTLASITATDPDNKKNKLTFKAASGLFTGSVINTNTGKPILVSGVVLQNQNVGAGYFLNSPESGNVLLSPAP